MDNSIIQHIENKEPLDQLAQRVMDHPSWIDDLVHTMLHEKRAIKYNCEKILRHIANTQPELIYPHFDAYVSLLDYPNNFLQWGAIITLARLTAVDTARRFDAIFEKYYGFIQGPAMVSACNVIGSSAFIAASRPDLTDRIVDHVLRVADAHYLHKGEPSPACQWIACGEAITFFGKVYDNTCAQDAIQSFVASQNENPRPKAMKAIRRFLKHHPPL